MKRLVSLLIALIMGLTSVSALAYEELAKGSKGDAVVELQERLNELGYSVGTADGDFGGKTEKAIMQYQQDNGIEVTGILDEITYGLMFQNEFDNVNAEDEPSTVEEAVKPSDIFESLEIIDIQPCDRYDLLILTDDNTLLNLDYNNDVWFLKVQDTDVKKYVIADINLILKMTVQ